jgi:hypothetical protein
MERAEMIPHANDVHLCVILSKFGSPLVVSHPVNTVTSSEDEMSVDQHFNVCHLCRFLACLHQFSNGSDVLVSSLGVLSWCLALSCLCLVVSCLVLLPCPVFVLSCVVLSCLVLSYLRLCCVVLCWVVFSWLVLSLSSGAFFLRYSEGRLTQQQQASFLNLHGYGVSICCGQDDIIVALVCSFHTSVPTVKLVRVLVRVGVRVRVRLRVRVKVRVRPSLLC